MEIHTALPALKVAALPRWEAPSRSGQREARAAGGGWRRETIERSGGAGWFFFGCVRGGGGGDEKIGRKWWDGKNHEDYSTN